MATNSRTDQATNSRKGMAIKQQSLTSLHVGVLITQESAMVVSFKAEGRNCANCKEGQKVGISFMRCMLKKKKLVSRYNICCHWKP